MRNLLPIFLHIVFPTYIRLSKRVIRVFIYWAKRFMVPTKGCMLVHCSSGIGMGTLWRNWGGKANGDRRWPHYLKKNIFQGKGPPQCSSSIGMGTLWRNWGGKGSGDRPPYLMKNIFQGKGPPQAGTFQMHDL